MMLIAVLAVAPAVAGQDADDYRGGWRTDSGEAHVYEFSIRGTTVRGVYCTYCADATTLAFIDGTFGPDGITFEVTHVKADGSTATKMQPHSAVESTATWVAWNVLVEDLARDAYSGRTQRLRYEDFVADPRSTVESVLDFVDVPASGSPFTDGHTVDLAANHTVSGNPGRFRTGAVALRPDDAWRAAQPRRRRLVSTALALPLLRRYGYPVQPRIPRQATRAAGAQQPTDGVDALSTSESASAA